VSYDDDVEGQARWLGAIFFCLLELSLDVLLTESAVNDTPVCSRHHRTGEHPAIGWLLDLVRNNHVLIELD